MNIFAQIKPIEHFSRCAVKIYTVQLEEDEHLRNDDEFTNWLKKHKDNEDIQKEFNDIISWINVISRGEHDLQRLLRHENSAHAFPPQTKFLDISYGEQLRLYCMLIGSETLILFNGGIKTQKEAQNCPNVSGFFRQANNLANRIQAEITDRNL